MGTGEIQRRQSRRGVLAWARGRWVVTAIAVVAVLLWIASFWYHVAWMNPNGTLIGVARGELYEASFPASSMVRAVAPSGEAVVGRNGTPLWWSGYVAGPPLTVTVASVSLQWWAAGIAAGWWGLVWWRLRHLREPHECWQCAYDRRGLAAEMACPECGAAGKAGAHGGAKSDGERRA